MAVEGDFVVLGRDDSGILVYLKLNSSILLFFGYMVYVFFGKVIICIILLEIKIISGGRI